MVFDRKTAKQKAQVYTKLSFALFQVDLSVQRCTAQPRFFCYGKLGLSLQSSVGTSRAKLQANRPTRQTAADPKQKMLTILQASLVVAAEAMIIINKAASASISRTRGPNESD